MTKPVIIVEGKSDVQRLENFIDADFVITNGSEISRETIAYLQTLAKTRRLFVFTDPDYPGTRIRHRIEEVIPSVKHLFIDKKDAVKGKKLGVCEAKATAIQAALAKIESIPTVKETSDITFQDLVQWGLVGTQGANQKRKSVMAHLGIGEGNAKTCLKRMQQIGLKRQAMYESWEDDHDSK